jgi:hypothetical protein
MKGAIENGQLKCKMGREKKVFHFGAPQEERKKAESSKRLAGPDLPKRRLVIMFENMVLLLNMGFLIWPVESLGFYSAL